MSDTIDTILKYRRAVTNPSIEDEDMMVLRLAVAKVFGKTPEDIIEIAKNFCHTKGLNQTGSGDGWESLSDHEKYFAISNYIPFVEVLKNSSGKRIIILTDTQK